MGLFIFITGLMIAGVTYAVTRSFRSPSTTDNTHTIHITLYEERLAELTDDRKAGRITKTDYEEAVTALKQQLLSDTSEERQKSATQPTNERWIVPWVIGYLPLMVIGLYLIYGEPRMVAPPAPASGINKAEMPAAILAMVNELKERIETHPEDAEAHAQLAQLYRMKGDLETSEALLRKALTLAPDNVGIQLDNIELTLINQNGVFSSDVQRQLMEILRTHPLHPRAMLLVAGMRRQQGDIKGAIIALEAYSALFEPESPERKEAQRYIDVLKSQ